MSNFFSKILEKWYLFVVWLLISCTLCFTVVDLAIKPKNEETISVFIGAYEVNIAALKSDLTEKSPEYLREVNIQAYSILDQYFGMYYQTYGILKADIVIIPESKIREDTAETVYAIIDEDYLKNYQLSSELYYINGNNLGIKIFDKESSIENTFITYSNSEEKEDYYAFISCSSKHGGKLTNSDYDTALKLLEVIYNYGKN